MPTLEPTQACPEICPGYGTPYRRGMKRRPSYSMINRWVEADGLLDTLDSEGIGSIAFTPLAQGLLTDKYLKGVPEDSRAAAGKSLDASMLSKANIERVRQLDVIAQRRGQSLAQMALAWVLRDGRMTSALIGASRVEQIEYNVAALANLTFSDEELTRIDAILAQPA